MLEFSQLIIINNNNNKRHHQIFTIYLVCSASIHNSMQYQRRAGPLAWVALSTPLLTGPMPVKVYSGLVSGHLHMNNPSPEDNSLNMCQKDYYCWCCCCTQSVSCTMMHVVSTYNLLLASAPACCCCQLCLPHRCIPVHLGSNEGHKMGHRNFVSLAMHSRPTTCCPCMIGHITRSLQKPGAMRANPMVDCAQPLCHASSHGPVNRHGAPAYHPRLILPYSTLTHLSDLKILIFSRHASPKTSHSHTHAFTARSVVLSGTIVCLVVGRLVNKTCYAHTRLPYVPLFAVAMLGVHVTVWGELPGMLRSVVEAVRPMMPAIKMVALQAMKS